MTQQPTPAVRTVLAWHEALNDGDVERLVGLSNPDIEVGGPRGTGRGADLIRAWVDRANVRLEPRRVFCRADTVVVQERAEWRSADSGRVIGEQVVASVFGVADELVASVARYDSLEDALNAVNLDESHEAR